VPARPDVLVLGAGIAGAAVARAAAQRGATVAWVDVRRAGEGATGRNAGFILADGADPYARVAQSQGRDVADALRAAGLATREAVRDLARHHDIGWVPSGSLRLAVDPDEAADLEATADALGLTWLAADRLPAPWRGGPWLGGLVDDGDGAVDPLHLLDAVVAEARRAGAALSEGVRVTRPERDGTRWRVVVGERVIEPAIVVVTASHASGALAPAGTADLRLTAWRAQMLAARVKPTPRAPRPVYARGGHDYLRVLSTGTVLLGGQRDEGGDEERTTDETPGPAVQRALERLLARWFPHAQRRKVIARWAGTMAFTPDGLPLAGAWPGADGLYVLAGLMGHGMGWGLGLGAAVAEAALGGAPAPAVFAPARGGV